MYRLICTGCGKEYPGDSLAFRCGCGEPLEVLFAPESKSFSSEGQSILNRFSSFLPPLKDEAFLSMGEGWTPMSRSFAFASECDFEFYLKNESINPTWSFKDRGTYLTLLDAVEKGYKGFGTVSTGNMAASVAAYGARMGMNTTILVSKNIPAEKIRPIAIYGPRVIKVDGDYGELYRKSLETGPSKGIYFSNSDIPMRVEGSKTIAFEIYLQLGEKVPDFVIVPTSSGGNIRGIEKGFREIKEAGLSERTPVMVAVQACGCAPIHNAFDSGREKIERVPNPSTIAHAIENPFPPSGNAVLRMLKKNGGLTLCLKEEEILEAQTRLAGEGLFAQPAGVTSVAAIKKLKELIPLKKARIVSIITGSGLKYPSILERHCLSAESISIGDLEAAL